MGEEPAHPESLSARGMVRANTDYFRSKNRGNEIRILVN